MSESWGDPVMDRICVHIGQQVTETPLSSEIEIGGQRFPAGTILSITYDVYSFAPTENRPDRGTHKEHQTAWLYMKVPGSEGYSPSFIESNLEQLTAPR